MRFHAEGGVREAQLHAVVIRADGSREDLGVIAYHSRNPLKRLLFRLTRKGF